jgi:hypothetical protein
VSDMMIVLISAASLSSGVLAALWLALSAPAARRSHVVGLIICVFECICTLGLLLRSMILPPLAGVGSRNERRSLYAFSKLLHKRHP